MLLQNVQKKLFNPVHPSETLCLLILVETELIKKEPAGLWIQLNHQEKGHTTRIAFIDTAGKINSIKQDWPKNE